MPVGLSEILPDALFYPNQKPAVIKFLQNVPAPATDKRTWLFQWALWVGSKINRYDYAAVEKGSIEV
jgi:hypothetical protein